MIGRTLYLIYTTHRAYNQLSENINIDALTQVYTRGKVDEWVNQCTHQAYTICIADIDFFKQVNDRYGHEVGDDVLKHFASYLRKHIREGDLLMRWGGEEFVLIFSASKEDIINKIQQLCSEMHNETWPQKHSTHRLFWLCLFLW